MSLVPFFNSHSEEKAQAGVGWVGGWGGVVVVVAWWAARGRRAPGLR